MSPLVRGTNTFPRLSGALIIPVENMKAVIPTITTRRKKIAPANEADGFAELS
jgi:hypothetical protein